MGEKSMKDIRIHNCGASTNDWETHSLYETTYLGKWVDDGICYNNSFVDDAIYDIYHNTFLHRVHTPMPEIKNVIFHDPATIVWWEDGTKTVVKAEGEKYDPEKGLTMAISKKALGNKGNYYEVIKKWVGDLMPRGEDVAEKKTLKKSKKDGDVGEEIKKTVEYERKNKKKRN